MIRTAASITNVEHVRDLELADGRAAPDVRDACLSIIGDTPRSDPVLLYCLRPKSVKKLAAFLTSALAATGSDRQVVYLFSDDDDSVGDFDSAGSTDSDADDSDIPDDA